jgi:geranylgeranyl diphosphate synthase type 3
LNHPEAIKIYNEEMMNLYRGQGAEIFWSDNSICPNEVEFLQAMSMRSVPAFSLTIRLMQLFSERTEDFSYLTTLMGEILDFKLSSKHKFWSTQVSTTKCATTSEIFLCQTNIT